MKKILKPLAAAAMTIVMCACLCACGGEAEYAEGDNTLVYGSSDYTAINPALFEHGEINLLLFAGLTAHDENNSIVPALDEKWDFN